MANFSLPIQIRWSDIDQNRHLRHSAYYDYGSNGRIQPANPVSMKIIPRTIQSMSMMNKN